MDLNMTRPFLSGPHSFFSSTMGYHHISWDVKIATIRLYEHNLLDLDDILHSCGFSMSTFYRILKVWRETGDVVKPAQHTPPWSPSFVGS